MQIRKIHEEHYQFKTAGQPHLTTSLESAGRQRSALQGSSESANSQSAVGSDEVAALLGDLRQLAENDVATIQLAQERFQSGELLSREAAEFVATSLIHDFNF